MNHDPKLFNQNDVDVLVNLGLTATQAKIYLYLSMVGQSVARDLSLITKIPRQDVYRVLNELFEIGLIQVVISSPKHFKAISPEDCLKLLVQRRNNRTIELQKSALQLLETFKERGCCKFSISCDQINLLQRREPILRETQEMLSLAQYSIDVLSPPQNLFPWIFEHSNFIKEVLDKKVKMRVITFKNGKNFSLPELIDKFKLLNFHIRYLAQIPIVSFGIYDKKQLILELDASNGYLESQVIVSSNSSLVEIASAYFEKEWKKSKDDRVLLVRH